MSRFPRLDILPAAQRALWPGLADIGRQSFVLYGGTAVALYCGHRESVDFDFFTHRAFQPDELFGRYPFLHGSEVLQSQRNTLTVLTSGNDAARVKVSFFGGLTFGCLERPRRTPDGVMSVASPEDLLAHKLKTLLQRVEPKDYTDIDALLRSGLSLSSGLAGASLLFPAFAPQECLKALTWFKDAALCDLPAELAERLVEAVKRVHDLPTLSLASRVLDECQT